MAPLLQRRVVYVSRRLTFLYLKMLMSGGKSRVLKIREEGWKETVES